MTSNRENNKYKEKTLKQQIERNNFFIREQINKHKYENHAAFTQLKMFQQWILFTHPFIDRMTLKLLDKF